MPSFRSPLKCHIRMVIIIIYIVLVVYYLYTVSVCVQVSDVDIDGRVLSTFTDVKSPDHVSVDSEDRVLVGDMRNDHVLLLNSQL